METKNKFLRCVCHAKEVSRKKAGKCLICGQELNEITVAFVLHIYTSEYEWGCSKRDLIYFILMAEPFFMVHLNLPVLTFRSQMAAFVLIRALPSARCKMNKHKFLWKILYEFLTQMATMSWGDSSALDASLIGSALFKIQIYLFSAVAGPKLHSRRCDFPLQLLKRYFFVKIITV